MQFLQSLLNSQPPVLFMVAGILFLAIAVVGSVRTYFDPGIYGRVASGVLGVALVILGLYLNGRRQPSSNPPVVATPSTQQSQAATSQTAPFHEPTHPHHAPDGAQLNNVVPQLTSTVCKFNSGFGPVAGKTYDYAPLAALPVGSPCQDGLGSIGIIIARPSGPVPSGMSTMCKFTNGPAAGTTRDFAPLTGLAIGAPCQDGMGDIGIIIPR